MNNDRSIYTLHRKCRRIPRRLTICLLGLGLSAGGIVEGTAQTATTRNIILAQNEPPETIVPGVSPAKDLAVRSNCDRVAAGKPLAVFSWTNDEGYKGRQKIEITPYRTGFKSRKTENLGELVGGKTGFEWGGGEAGINYYWRVLTLMDVGWVASENARYEVPTCPVDFERPKETTK